MDKLVLVIAVTAKLAVPACEFVADFTEQAELLVRMDVTEDAALRPRPRRLSFCLLFPLDCVIFCDF